MAHLPPPPDAVTNQPSEADLSRFSTLLDRYKKRILDPDAGERPILAKYGWLVIDHVGLRTDEI